MDPKLQPNDRLDLEALRRLGPDGRMRKCFELSDMVRRQFIKVLRERYPDATEEEFRTIVVRKVLEWSNSNY